MKGTVCFVVTLMFCLSLSGVYCADNLLKDPGFEELTKVEDVIVGSSVVWQVRAAEAAKGPLAEPAIDTKDKVEGKQSLYVKRLKAGWVDVQQGWWSGNKEVVLKAGQEYTLSAWMKSTAPGDLSIKITSWLAPFPNWVTKKVTMGQTWKEYFASATPKEDTERPWWEFRIEENLADLWIDNAMFYEGKYVPSTGAVSSQDKLAGTWGEIKRAQ